MEVVPCIDDVPCVYIVTSVSNFKTHIIGVCRSEPTLAQAQKLLHLHVKQKTLAIFGAGNADRNFKPTLSTYGALTWEKHYLVDLMVLDGGPAMVQWDILSQYRYCTRGQRVIDIYLERSTDNLLRLRWQSGVDINDVLPLVGRDQLIPVCKHQYYENWVRDRLGKRPYCDVVNAFEVGNVTHVADLLGLEYDRTVVLPFV